MKQPRQRRSAQPKPEAPEEIPPRHAEVEVVAGHHENEDGYFTTGATPQRKSMVVVGAATLS
jgi:hypothetical protein